MLDVTVPGGRAEAEARRQEKLTIEDKCHVL